MSAFASECLFNVSVCFHAEALSNNHTLKVAHSPALSYRRYTLLTTTSHLLQGNGKSHFSTKCKVRGGGVR